MNTMKTSVLEIEGMTCGSCVRHVGEALRSIDGVEAADVNLREGAAEIRHDPVRAPVSLLIDSLKAEGWPAAPRQ